MEISLENSPKEKINPLYNQPSVGIIKEVHESLDSHNFGNTYNKKAIAVLCPLGAVSCEQNPDHQPRE